MADKNNQPIRITIFDCAIKTASTSCITRLKELFPTFHWIDFRAQEMTSDDYEIAKHSDIFFIFGSHSNVEDFLPWHLTLANFCKSKILAGAPTLGLCFGHQLMGHYFGGVVSRHLNPPQSGVRKISLNHFGKNEIVQLGVSHSYEISNLPNDFEIIGTSPECRADIVKHKTLPYIGFQSHPEASDSFFQNECPQLNQIERDLVTSEGHKMIAAFLQMAEKVLANSSKRA